MLGKHRKPRTDLESHSVSFLSLKGAAKPWCPKFPPALILRIESTNIQINIYQTEPEFKIKFCINDA